MRTSWPAIIVASCLLTIAEQASGREADACAGKSCPEGRKCIVWQDAPHCAPIDFDPTPWKTVEEALGEEIPRREWNEYLRSKRSRSMSFAEYMHRRYRIRAVLGGVLLIGIVAPAAGVATFISSVVVGMIGDGIPILIASAVIFVASLAGGIASVAINSKKKRKLEPLIGRQKYGKWDPGQDISTELSAALVCPVLTETF